MRIPLLMMRTRGLCGPFFRKAFGSRSSHPLAHTQGNAISAATVVALSVDLLALASFMQNEGWTVTIPPGGFSIMVDGDIVLKGFLQACDFSSLDGQLAHDLCEGMQLQGFCSGGCS